LPFKLPVLVRVFVVFVLILFLNRRRVPFFLCLFFGAFLLGLWMRLRPAPLLLMILKDITSSQSLWLASIIAAILTLSNLLERAGQLSRIVKAFDRLSHSRKFTTLAMPALIGLLPMPAGALVSAPMVQESYPRRGRDPELKAAINYWFRHLWEYWWPLYPGVILAISLLQVETWRFVLAQMPLTAGAITGGLIFIARHIPEAKGNPSEGERRGAFLDFLRETMPIVIILIFLFGFQALQHLLHLQIPFAPPKYLGFALGLLASILWVMRKNRLGRGDLLSSLLKPSVPQMAMVIFGIMAFKGMLVKSAAVEMMRQELSLYRIPPLLIIAFLPFVAGLVTGAAIGFVGTTFPLVISLIHPSTPGGIIPYGLLAYGFGYMGMMLTPLHLCFLVSKDFFQADPMRIYRYLWRPALLILSLTTILFFLYRSILIP